MTADAAQPPITAPSGQARPCCPVCRAPGCDMLGIFDKRHYWACGQCAARFLDPRHHPLREAEYRHYRHHNNDVADAGYRRFLSRLAAPLLERLAPGLNGLDYGCGPGPALASMLREAGHRMTLHDPFFHPDPAALRGEYDFITCTEAAEHFHRPADEFDRLFSLIRPGGWLAIMTCFQTDDARFANWHYRHDPTHVVFYREETMRHIASSRGWSCTIPVKDVALMRKPV